MSVTNPYSETIVPRAAVTFPLKVPMPERFVPERLDSWPRVSGRLEYFEGALWYIPPGLRRVPPVLAVEVAGVDDTAGLLRDKAAWYLERGVEVVWLVFPDERRVEVIARDGSTIFEHDATLAPHAGLPGLAPRVRDLFLQLDER
jgi:hypothetical protein